MGPKKNNAQSWAPRNSWSKLAAKYTEMVRALASGTQKEEMQRAQQNADVPCLFIRKLSMRTTVFVGLFNGIFQPSSESKFFSSH